MDEEAKENLQARLNERSVMNYSEEGQPAEGSQPTGEGKKKKKKKKGKRSKGSVPEKKE